MRGDFTCGYSIWYVDVWCSFICSPLRVTAVTVFGDSGQQSIYSGIALAHESGKIEMQYFSRHFTVHIEGEEEKLESMMAEGF